MHDDPRNTGNGERATDEVYNWVEQSDGYLLSLRLPEGMKKREDFSVCVDGKRRLTITERRNPGNGKAQFNKKFQLPKTAKPDSITGRFDGDTLMLTLTVPTKGPHKPAVTAAGTTKKEEEEPKAKDKEEPTDEAKAEREKKLINTAIAAFMLGVLFSHRLFSPAGTNKK